MRHSLPRACPESEVCSEHDGFCEVQSTASGRLKDLLAAAEPVRNDERVRRRLAHGGQKYPFAGGLCNRVFFAFESKGSRHSAAPRVEGLYFCSHFAKQRFGVRHFHKRFLMAVPV